MTASQPDSAVVRRGVRPPRAARLTPLLVLVLAALVAACGNSGSGQSGSGFIFLSVDSFSLNGSTGVASINSFISDLLASTQACATLRNNLKNPTVTVPTSLDNVVIQSYTVRLIRSDGKVLDGPFTFNTSVLVPVGTVASGSPTVSGNTAVIPLVVVPASVKRNRGVRPPVRLPLAVTAEVVFKGRDGRGQSVETQGALTVVFLTEGTDAAASCAGSTTGTGTTGTTGTGTTGTGTTGTTGTSGT